MSGELVPDNLQLKQQVTSRGREWKIQIAGESDADALTGEDLTSFMKAVANNDELPAELLHSKPELADLSTSKEFRTFCRITPGIESPEHKALREKTQNAVRRAHKSLGIIFRGAGRLDSTTPRSNVGEGYWLSEVVMRDSPLTSGEVRQLTDVWRQIEGDKPALVEWVDSKHNEWEDSGSDRDFVPWVSSTAYEQSEYEAYEASGTTLSLAAWREEQSMYPLAAPRWKMEVEWKNDMKNRPDGVDEIDFVTFARNEAEGCKAALTRVLNETDGLLPGVSTVDDALLFKLDGIMQQFFRSGSRLGSEAYMAKQLWLETNPEDTSDEAFRSYMDQQVYEDRQAKPDATPVTFSEWKSQRETALYARYEGSNLPISFEKWKKEQVKDVFGPTQPFVRLEDRDRQPYATKVDGGRLLRNGRPLDTTHDYTEHSKEGSAIFVIGPDDDLYCSSHVGGVFHHSSLLADGIVKWAGEVRTDSAGKIVALSSKSGHYRPTDRENEVMLRWFASLGVNLDEVEFSYFTGPNEETAPTKAGDYLRGLSTD